MAARAHARGRLRLAPSILTSSGYPFHFSLVRRIGILRMLPASPRWPHLVRTQTTMRSGRDPPEPLGSKAREELLEEIYRYGGEHSAREVGLEIGGKGDRVRTGVLGRREIDGDVRGHEEIVERREEEEVECL
eukprot:1366874-Amorphochlora_amoeboformis.AAC.1